MAIALDDIVTRGMVVFDQIELPCENCQVGIWRDSLVVTMRARAASTTLLFSTSHLIIAMAASVTP